MRRVAFDIAVVFVGATVVATYAALEQPGLRGLVLHLYVLLAVAGAADFVSGVLRSTIVMTETPDAMRGRVSGIEFAQVAAAPSLGNLEAGVVASLAGVKASIVSGGIGCVLGVALLSVALLRFRRYRAAPEEPAICYEGPRGVPDPGSSRGAR